MSAAEAAEELEATARLQAGADVLRTVEARAGRALRAQEEQRALLETMSEALQPPLAQGGITSGAMRAALGPPRHANPNPNPNPTPNPNPNHNPNPNPNPNLFG